MNLKSSRGISVFMLIGLSAMDVRLHAKTPDALEERFLNPPAMVKPYVWWHWMGSNFSQQGITKDLEAMKAAGIGGATIFNLSSAVQESHAPTLNNPWPEQTYRSPAYWQAMKHAVAEAARLGLEIGLHNTVGYSTTGGPWIDEERSMQHLVWSDTTVTGGHEIALELKRPVLIADEGWGKTGRQLYLYKDVVVLAVPAGEKKIATNQVRNITTRFDPVHGLKWNAPPGKWTIYRMGHASTGRPPHPVPDDLLGQVLEADKMSVKQTTFHWDQVLDPLQAYLGPYLGNSFKHILIDSYEAGDQNWTPDFREQFIKRKGYDPIPWLVSFCLTVGAGKEQDRRILNDAEQSRRFDWDYSDVIAQLFFDNGWKIGKTKVAQAGLSLQFEPYGGPFDTAQGVSLADLPMAEFWTAGVGDVYPVVPAAARANGKTVVGAEAFTGRPEKSQYTEDPAFLKPSADKAFAAGINRLILHHWVHQPFDDRYQPCMGMGWWGTHFGRNQTWLKPAKAFFTYLARCQALLQYGEQAADYLCVDRLQGFADLISTRDFLEYQFKVEKGKIVLPSGRRYCFAAFSDSVMLPQTAEKIKDLVSQGAMIVSPKPVKSPSLQDYPRCDARVRKTAAQVWGEHGQNSFGKGFIFTKLDDAVRKSEIAPDFFIEQADSPDDIKMVHRHAADADIYFVLNQSAQFQHLVVSFRMSGKQPELWHAEDGSIIPAPVWRENKGRTSVDLTLHAGQTIFVIFCKPALPVDHPVQLAVIDAASCWHMGNDKTGQAYLSSADSFSAKVDYASGKSKTVALTPTAPIEISGPWQVAFTPQVGQRFEIGFPVLIDFSTHADKAVNYFAGTAVFLKKISIKASMLNKDRRWRLDLGEMNDIAEVVVNGTSLGVLWYPPYAIDVTAAVQPGENEIKIIVTTNWANRLIGDEQEPADFAWGQDRGESMGRAMLSYPDWFLKNLPRPSQGRKTFSIWYYYRPTSPLQPAGLVGPVRLVCEARSDL